MTVTFFGHRNTPYSAQKLLNEAIIDLIENQGADTFYVGSQGNFDRIALKALEDISADYDIEYAIVLAYFPQKQSELVDYSHTIYPDGMENVPRKFAISKRNEWMVKQSDLIVAYVSKKFGGAYNFMKLAERKGKKVINLAGL